MRAVLGRLSAMSWIQGPRKQQTSLDSKSGHKWGLLVPAGGSLPLLPRVASSWCCRMVQAQPALIPGVQPLACYQGTEPILQVQICSWRRNHPPAACSNKPPTFTVMGVSICYPDEHRAWLFLRAAKSSGSCFCSAPCLDPANLFLVIPNAVLCATLLPQFLNLMAHLLNKQFHTYLL